MHWLTSIDRRWIFLLVAITVVGAFVFPFPVPLKASKTVAAVHAKIESLAPTVEGRERPIILFSMDYDPSSRPELEPMARAMIRHSVSKGHRVLGMTHWPTGIATTKRVFVDTLAEFDEVVVGFEVFESKADAKDEVDALGERFKALKDLENKEKLDILALFGTSASMTAGSDEEKAFAKKVYGPQVAVARAAVAAAAAPGDSKARAAKLLGALGSSHPNSAVVVPGRNEVVATFGEVTFAFTPEVHKAIASASVGTYARARLEDGRHAVFHIVHRKGSLIDGDDYCYLGYKPGLEILMISMGQSLYESFPTDIQGRNTRQLKILEDLPNLKKLDYLVTLAAGDTGEKWVSYGRERFGFPVSVGCTAVMAPDLFPYLQAKQIDGIVGGIRGAWEYESLTGFAGDATKVVSPQTAAHILIILLIVLCNVGYFLSRKQK